MAPHETTQTAAETFLEDQTDLGSESDWTECPTDMQEEHFLDNDSTLFYPTFKIEGFTYDAPSKTYKPTTELSKTQRLISDPLAVTKDPVGCMFRTLRKCHYSDPHESKDLAFDVGDLVRVVETPRESWNEWVVDGFGIYYVQAVNLRTGKEGRVHWHCFRSVGKREICPCYKQNCVCVYDDYEVSLKHHNH